MFFDAEVRFDCSSSRNMRPASLAGSILRGIYHKIVMSKCVSTAQARAKSLAVRRGAKSMQSESLCARSYCNEPIKTRFLVLLELSTEVGFSNGEVLVVRRDFFGSFRHVLGFWGVLPA